MNEKTKIFLVPAAIVVAGIIIAVSIFISGSMANGGKQVAEVGAEGTARIRNMNPIHKQKDHILGNPLAAVQVVEYSDMDCPYCQRFNGTVKEVLAAYGDKIAVVYRHLPLTMLHQNAQKEAEATECAAKLGGNEGFWKYFDKYEEELAAKKTFSNELLLSVAEVAGISRTNFESCLNSDEPGKLVKEDTDNAAKIGISGTPFSIIVVNGKPTDTIEGAYPIEAVKAKLDQYIK